MYDHEVTNQNESRNKNSKFFSNTNDDIQQKLERKSKRKEEKRREPIVGERSSSELALEIKLRRRLLLPTPESPINKTLKE